MILDQTREKENFPKYFILQEVFKDINTQGHDILIFGFLVSMAF